MAFNAQILRVLIASPSDCKAERELIPQLLQKWNSLHAFDFKTILIPAKWEDDSYPSLDNPPQELINKQLVRDADILLGFFWTRLGTATGKAASGSLEEINEFLAANKPVLLYFSNQPVRPDAVNDEQYRALKEFRIEMQQRGLVVAYEDVSELRESVPAHLTRTIRERFPTKETGQPALQHGSSKINAGIALSELIRRPKLAWAAEKTSGTHTDEEGKAILGTLFEALLSWRADFESAMEEDIIRDADKTVRDLKALTQLRMAMDGGVTWNAFWDGGDALFSSLERLMKRLSSTAQGVTLSEDATALLKEIDSYVNEHARGITVVDGRKLGPGLGHYFPYQWSPHENRGDGSVAIIKIAPVKRCVSELVDKGFLQEDCNDGRFLIYSRTVKPAPSTE